MIVLTLRNPLSNAIYVDDIQLYANLEESSEADKPLSPKSLRRKRSNSKITLLEDDLAALEGDEEKEEEQNKNTFEVTPISLQFEPKSSRVVYLRIVPKVSGSFRIVGVRRKLRRGAEESSTSSASKVDAVFGRREFVLPGRPLNRTRKQRSSRARALDMRLHFKVIESRPWLGVKLQEEESIQSMYQGEMKRLRFSIRNHGNAKITSLKVMCCNPVFSICCCTKKGSFAECSDVLGRIVNVSNDKALNSPDTKCQDIDLWVRAETSGKHDLQILFNYEGPPHSASGSGEKDERWRSVEFSKCLEIYRLCKYDRTLYTISCPQKVQRPSSNQECLPEIDCSSRRDDDQQCLECQVETWSEQEGEFHVASESCCRVSRCHESIFLIR